MDQFAFSFIFQSWVHKGCISAPCLARWPNGILEKPGSIHHHSWIVMNYNVCGMKYPKSYYGSAIPKLEGVSFISLYVVNQAKRSVPMSWERQGNRAVQHCKWRLIYAEYQSDN